MVRRGKPEEVVADLIKHLGSVSTVAFHQEVEAASPRLPATRRELSRPALTLSLLRPNATGDVRGAERGEASEGRVRADEGPSSHLLGVDAVPQR